MALILAFIFFAAFADESIRGLKAGIMNLDYKMNKSGGHLSFYDNKGYMQQLHNDASPVIHSIKNSRVWLPTPPPG